MTSGISIRDSHAPQPNKENWGTFCKEIAPFALGVLLSAASAYCVYRGSFSSIKNVTLSSVGYTLGGASLSLICISLWQRSRNSPSSKGKLNETTSSQCHSFVESSSANKTDEHCFFESTMKKILAYGDTGALNYFIREFSVQPDALELAVVMASEYGRLDFLETLLQKGPILNSTKLMAQENANSLLKTEICKALENANIRPSTQKESKNYFETDLFPSESFSPEEMLNFIINKSYVNLFFDACKNNDIESLNFLYCMKVSIPLLMRESAIIDATNKQRLPLVRALLRFGPITSLFKEKVSENAKGPLKRKLLEIIEEAREFPSTHDVCTSDPKGYSLTFSEIQENPAKYLKLFSEYGIPTKIILSDQPGQDAGGILQQTITTLITACIEKKVIHLSAEGMPMILDPKKDLESIQNLSLLFCQLEKRNQLINIQYILGELFNPLFYKLLKASILQPVASENEVIKFLAKTIQSPASEVVLAPENLDILNAYKRWIGEEAISDQEAIENAKNYFRPFVKAADAFFPFIFFPLLFKQYLRKSAEELAERFQGKPCSPEALINKLKFSQFEVSPSYFNQVEWLKKTIRNSDLEWRRQFIFSATGCRNINPSSVISIVDSGQNQPFIGLYTCSQTISFPNTIDMNENQFLSLLNYAIEGEDFAADAIDMDSD